MDPLKSISQIAASGMHVQSARLQVVAENVANADSTGATPGDEPYRRKTISFQEALNRESGLTMVEVSDIGRDQSPFTLRHDPAHPAADENGFVKMPNVSPILEMANMREASRSYEANMNLYEAGRRMRSQMIDLLK
ncbi:flagellar basal body rod protein FlgC [Pseudooceanicola lipolyticus]|uniref:Flagellar basal-body rod protein FlgC n=1 Tax=Pseudooceanicola lipolyticus TaxID=2029104 RepID=A0A2M8IW06_9RHOB|nr:flagellar basal body rod protein FlgC [Pseudooceanicola lipolyticus]PJE34668.1 flagellar basal body rod protein FlgC [Pseudooceanicola lipolyticus]